jgi:nicotinamide-nucleotide amidase
MNTTPVIEILAVGNELLNAGVQDTNTFWLCRLFTRLGGRVRRAVLLPDDEEAIAAEVKASVLRAADAVVVTGGLGPTADDVTVSGVARATGAPLRLNEEALRMVRERYDALAAKGVVSAGGINPAREKMAWLPAGAVPLANPAGTAPGVLMKAGRTSLVCLPGVPQEMQAIVETSLHDFLAEVFTGGRFIERRLIVDCNDESLLDPLFRRVAADYPGVAVKARAGLFAETPRLEVFLSVTAGGGEGEGDAEEALEKAAADLQRLLAEAGFGA